MDNEEEPDSLRALAVSIEYGVMAIFVAGAFVAGLVEFVKALF
jgi:hypothetical protein